MVYNSDTALFTLHGSIWQKGTQRQIKIFHFCVSQLHPVQLPFNSRAMSREVSPKFNCCKMEYLLILRFKGPLRFSMFRTRLSRKLAWPCVFLNGLRDFSCREKEALYFCLRSCKGFFNRFLSLRCSTVTLLEVGALACFYEWMDSVSDFATYA